MTPHEELLVHSQPVNRTAALHVAGGDRLGREELLWAQREAFERVMIDARLRNMGEEQRRRREMAARSDARLGSWMGIAKKRERVLRSLQSGSATVEDLGHQGRVWAQGRMGWPANENKSGARAGPMARRRARRAARKAVGGAKNG